MLNGPELPFNGRHPRIPNPNLKGLAREQNERLAAQAAIRKGLERNKRTSNILSIMKHAGLAIAGLGLVTAIGISIGNGKENNTDHASTADAGIDTNTLEAEITAPADAGSDDAEAASNQILPDDTQAAK